MTLFQYNSQHAGINRNINKQSDVKQGKLMGTYEKNCIHNGQQTAN